eukprot:s796_g16.t1
MPLKLLDAGERKNRYDISRRRLEVASDLVDQMDKLSDAEQQRLRPIVPALRGLSALQKSHTSSLSGRAVVSAPSRLRRAASLPFLPSIQSVRRSMAGLLSSRRASRSGEGVDLPEARGPGGELPELGRRVLRQTAGSIKAPRLEDAAAEEDTSSRASSAQSKWHKVSTDCVHMATAQAVAEDAQAQILKHFTHWDADGSGTIDKDELATIMYKVSSSMSQRDITRLLAVIDTNQDGLIDFREFVAWITDRRADRTVGNDGWIEHFDVEMLLRPMFEVFDRNKDGLILRAELEECSQILGNSLSIHPSASPDCLAMDWKQLPSNETVNFQQFVDWQVSSLEKCGIPNNQLPRLLEELCESLQIIFDIDRLHDQGVDNSRVHDALAESVRKVADTTRRIYTRKLSNIDNQDEAMPEERAAWVCPPDVNDMHLLARLCAKRSGVRLLNYQEEGTIEPAAAERARHRPSAIPTASTSSRPGRGRNSVSNLPQSPATKKVRKLSIRSEVRLAIGHVSVCIPDTLTDLPPADRPWMAKVTRSQYDIDQRRMINDVLIYVLNRASSIWTVMKDTRHFDRAWNALPPALQLFALLKAQALMADCISWHGTKTAMETAENYGLVSAEACDKYQVWVGVLNMDMEALVDFEANYKNATHTFGEVLPFAEALVKAGLTELKGLIRELGKEKAQAAPRKVPVFGLDPGTVAAARAAGVDEASLLDGEALGQVEQLAAEGSHMEAAVVQLTKIVSNLSQPSKKPQSDLDSILDVGGASGSNEAQSLGSGRKNAAALRQLTKIYIENPKVIYEALVKQMELDFQVAAPTWSAKGCRVFYRPGMVVDEVAASSVPDPDPVVVVSTLYDVRWTDIFLGVLRERDAFSDMKKKLQGGRRDPPPNRDGKESGGPGGDPPEAPDKRRVVILMGANFAQGSGNRFRGHGKDCGHA